MLFFQTYKILEFKNYETCAKELKIINLTSKKYKVMLQSLFFIEKQLKETVTSSALHD